MNRVLFSIRNINIYWYSVLIIVAIVLGYIIAREEVKKKKIDVKFFDDLIFYVVIVAIIGARLYYVIFNFDEFDSLLSIIAIYNGGLAIYGGIISAILFIYFYCKRRKVDFLKMLDILAPSLILGQAIGRWGNFFNQEAYGGVVSYDFLNSLHIPNFIIDNMYIDGVYHHPTFLYESLFCLIGFIILMIVRKRKSNVVGSVTYMYLIYYGIVRFFIEGMRDDSLYLFSFRISQIVSIIFIFVGIFGIMYNKRRKSDG